MNRSLRILTIAAVLVVGACGDDDGDVSGAPTTRAEPVDLGGTYEAQLGSSSDLLVEPNPEGRWLLEIQGDTVVFETPDGQRFAPGDPVTVEGATMTLSADPQCPTQEGEAVEGRYDFRLEGDQVTFTEVEDSCRDRAFVLTSQTWTRTGG